MRRFLFLQVLLVVGSSACSADTAALKEDSCSAGTTESCVCEDGRTGKRECEEKGIFGECVCVESGGAAANGGPGAGSGGSSAGRAGTSGEGGAGGDTGTGGTGGFPPEGGAGVDAGAAGADAATGGTGIDAGTAGADGAVGDTDGGDASGGDGGDGGTTSFCETLQPCCVPLILPPLVAACLLVANAGSEADCEQAVQTFCP
jgi:hypothetical protein